jgi:hypothetical protein
MAMVKPQYGIFLLWAALRRKFGAFAACAAVLVIGLISSLAFFGLRANLEYLGVLSYLSHHGEIYFPNQSMGGLLNRALFNGNSFVFSRGTYPPYNPVVYWGTVVSSVILLVYGLMPPRNRTSSGGASDLACVMLIATMASPIAWEHHYGILFAILVWLAVRSLGRKPSRGEDLALLAAYCLTSNLLSIAGLTAHVPVLNLVQSYLYFGALLTLGLLVLAMRKGDLKWQRMHEPVGEEGVISAWRPGA